MNTLDTLSISLSVINVFSSTWKIWHEFIKNKDTAKLNHYFWQLSEIISILNFKYYRYLKNHLPFICPHVFLIYVKMKMHIILKSIPPLVPKIPVLTGNTRKGWNTCWWWVVFNSFMYLTAICIISWKMASQINLLCLNVTIFLISTVES